MKQLLLLVVLGGITTWAWAAGPENTPGTRTDVRGLDATPAATPPTTQPARATREEKTKTVFDFLMKEYKGMLVKSKDRLGRSLVLVCMSRIPRADATAELLTHLRNEKDPLIQMVCWEALLARANGLSEAEFKQWSDATKPLLASNFFRGDLRVAALRFMALSPPDSKTKETFNKYFTDTNSMDAHDYPTIQALGETMRAWGDPAIVEAIMGRLAVLDDAQRAEIVLRSAGADVPYAISRRQLGSAEMWKKAQADYSDWWSKQRPKWKVRSKTEPGEWKKLGGQYMPRVDLAQTVDPDDKQWYRDLELRPPNLRVFSVGLVVDTTGSMGQVLVWLRSDLKRMMEAFKFVALEPQMGLTFYRDVGDDFIAKTVPLSGRLETLSAALSAMDAKGGGDIPEAVREGLRDALTVSKWPTSPKQPKALVLIGDAPPKPETQAECEQIVKDAAAKGFRLYAVKVRTGWEADDLRPLDRLAAAGNGSTIWADMRLGRAQEGGKGGGGPGMNAGRRGLGPEAMRRMAQFSSSGASDSEPGEEVVTRVLIDAINPQFSDRVKPPVAILWQMLKDPTKETHQPFPPPQPPDPNRVKNPKPPMPFDPQKQK